jgi:cytochrome c oxidase assembly protein subunit 19
MNFSTSKQFVRPPQRGIFPLDHDAECRPKMEVSLGFYSFLSLKLFVDQCISRNKQIYLECLKASKDVHHKCRELSREYLQCRMNHQLMSDENLDNVS